MMTDFATTSHGDLADLAPESVDVAVIGAGPVGLTLATLLASYGARTAIFDRAAGPARFSRAAVVHARTLETLDALGVTDEMLEHGVQVPVFGVRDRDRRLLKVGFGELQTPYPFTLMLPQDETEAILRAALERRGAQIRWGHELTGLRQEDDGATLTVTSAEREMQVHARYVVGCDGARSVVRELSGIPFEGETYPQSFVLADVDMDWPLSRDEVQLFFSPEGLVVVAPLPGERRYRIVATVDEAPPEPSLADVQALLDARGPRQSRSQVERVIWSSRFRVHHRLAARFRSGPAFLCGDAAHVHSPAGGLGMNTGIQDAANLAWKLALTLKGGAADSLLDSYGTERRQAAEQVVATTHRLTRLATMRSPALRLVRNVAMASADWVGVLPRRLAGNLAQVDIAYTDGWRVDASTAIERLVPSGRGDEVGSSPEFQLLVPRSFEAQADTALAHYRAATVRLGTRAGLEESLLVRPDGYVAGRAPAGEYERLLAALTGALSPSGQAERRAPLLA